MTEIKSRPSDEKVKRIVNWRESIMTLPDEQFFELVRIYLGEIQSPFNKQNLVERLSSIFRKQDVKDAIVGLLSPFDIKILTLISTIESATQQKIVEFFYSEYKLSDIYSELLNLNERMLIYHSIDPDTKSKILKINPLLEETLSPFLNVSKLFSPAICAERNIESPFFLTPQFLAALLSYISAYPELCKNDGSLKKKDLERLSIIFQGKENCLQLLLNGFLNLGILKMGEKAMRLDEKRLALLADEPFINQLAFLCVASALHLGRENLRSQAQLLLDLLASIPEEPILYQSLSRMAFIICNKSNNETNGATQSRFSRMLEARRASDPANIVSEENSSLLVSNDGSSRIIEKIINSAIEFGLFEKYGTDENGAMILTKGSTFVDSLSSQSSMNQNFKGSLNINAGTSITLMPGLNLSQILEITSFMNIVSCNTVSEYEISRKSISRAFDKNLKPEQIYSILEKYTAYEIPQNLRMNIEDWFNSYSSAILYKGYVVQVDEKSARVLENNPKMKEFIKSKLAPGVFLLNIDLNDDPENFISQSGLDFMGSVKNAEHSGEAIALPALRTGKVSISVESTEETDSQLASLSKKAEEEKAEYEKQLYSMELNDQQRECLLSRIRRGVIISPALLKKENVRLEILEADGIDFANKVRLMEKAISSKDSIEIYIPSDSKSDEIINILGKPLSITRQANDSLVKFCVNETEEIRFFSVGKISKVKLIKTSVFAD